MKRSVLIGIIAVAVVAAGVFAYVKLRPGQAVQGQQDPALQIALALAALERSDTALTVEQIKVVLPLLKVLRDTDPNDTEASKALADGIRKVLTPEQLATIDRMRQEAQARRQQGGGGLQGPRRGPGGQGFGPGGSAPGRVAFRAQARQFLLARLIRRLEQRLQ